MKRALHLSTQLAQLVVKRDANSWNASAGNVFRHLVIEPGYFNRYAFVLVLTRLLCIHITPAEAENH
jgi:hypothetical protein